MAKLEARKTKSPLKVTAQASDGADAPLPIQHAAIIMDGNRRWADLKSLPRLLGHREGVKSLKRLVRHVGARKLGYLTVYAFSSENWQRSTEEVHYLFDLFQKVLIDELDELADNDVCLRFLGHMPDVPEKVFKQMKRAEERTQNNSGLKLQVAINYGSRQEITEAAKQIAREVAAGRISADDVTEELLSSYLYTGEMPDPELLIRTGGEMRLSNYLLWQSAYTELYVTPKLWPDFGPDDFDQAIAEFTGRKRRYGGD